MIWYSPLAPLLLGVALMGIAALMSRPRLALIGLLLLLPAYALMTPLGANLLVLVIEHRVKAVETTPVCDQVQAVVLLSGGLRRPAETGVDFGALTPETLDRVFAWQGLDSQDANEKLPLIIAGGGPFRIPEAEVIVELMQRLGLQERSLTLEIASTSTLESALAVRELLPELDNRIALASSALHLPRAMLAFEQVGFEVCPRPLNRHYLAVSGWTILLPHSSSLAKSETAIHEIIGEIHYRIKAREVNDSEPVWYGAGQDLRPASAPGTGD